jgi:protein-S-isoprenylcysteine O-methyltransferase Ste14
VRLQLSNLIYHWLFPIVWIAFVVYWFISALGVKRNKKSEPATVRIAQLVCTLFAGVLMYSGWFRASWLSWRVLLQSKLTFITGGAMLVAGLGFAVSARVHLGQYWSARVALKEEHQLIRSGPYQIVRHPIYTGIITALAGTAVAIGQLQSFIGVALFAAIYYFKSRREERFLVKEFGDDYVRYRMEVPALVPLLV